MRHAAKTSHQLCALLPASFALFVLALVAPEVSRAANASSTSAPSSCSKNREAQETAYTNFERCLDGKGGCTDELDELIKKTQAAAKCGRKGDLEEGGISEVICADCSACSVERNRKKTEVLNCAMKWRYASSSARIPKDSCRQILSEWNQIMATPCTALIDRGSAKTRSMLLLTKAR